MKKFLLISLLFTVSVGSSLDDHEKTGQVLDHDRTVINCRKYKREANQHSCVLSPVNVEGPFFLPSDYERADLTDSQLGIPFEITIKLVNSADCTPLAGMFIHIWSANSLGFYSGVQSEPPAPGQPSKMKIGPNGIIEGRPEPENDERFLRGYQVTNQDGQVTFIQVIPGWYAMRALHTHIEVYTSNSTDINSVTYVGQLFYPNDLPMVLKLINPYSENKHEITLNENDFLYRDHGGNQTKLELLAKGNGYSTSITLGIDPTITVKVEV